MPHQPKIGDPAPAFTAQITGGGYGDESTLSLSDLAGETVVLYFYPKVKPSEHLEKILEVL